MKEDPTPLLGNDSGFGWHLKPKRRFLLYAALVVAAFIFIAPAIDAYKTGKVVAALFLFLISSLPLAALADMFFKPSFPPRVVATDEVEADSPPGVLLPVRSTSGFTLWWFLWLGLLFILAPVVVLSSENQQPKAALAAFSVVPIVIGLLFWLGFVGGLRNRAKKNKGVLLSSEGLFLYTQIPTVVLNWGNVTDVYPRWNRLRTASDALQSVEDPINNWLVFETVNPPEQTMLSAMAKTKHPVVNATAFACDPHLALAACRQALVHRAMLTEPQQFLDYITKTS